MAFTEAFKLFHLIEQLSRPFHHLPLNHVNEVVQFLAFFRIFTSFLINVLKEILNCEKHMAEFLLRYMLVTRILFSQISVPQPTFKFIFDTFNIVESLFVGVFILLP